MSKVSRSPNRAFCRLKSYYRSPNSPKLEFRPMVTYPEVVEGALSRYDEVASRIHRAASLVEEEGYCTWPKLREIAKFARKLGIAFCVGLSSEAEHVVRYLENRGFKVYSCTVSAVV